MASLEKIPRNLHPSLRSRRVRAFLARTQDALWRAEPPPGGSRRPAERADIDRHDLDLLDLLTVALDLADEEELQMLLAYARTSLVIALGQAISVSEMDSEPR